MSDRDQSVIRIATIGEERLELIRTLRRRKLMNNINITAGESALMKMGAYKCAHPTPWGDEPMWLIDDPEWGPVEVSERAMWLADVDGVVTAYGDKHPDYDHRLRSPRPRMARSVGSIPTEHPEYYHPLFGECEWYWQEMCDVR